MLEKNNDIANKHYFSHTPSITDADTGEINHNQENLESSKSLLSKNIMKIQQTSLNSSISALPLKMTQVFSDVVVQSSMLKV